jgi:alkylation response protein AidB-like acyl-CoA dehydrogenase
MEKRIKSGRSEEQIRIREFVINKITSEAKEIDRLQEVPRNLIDALASAGFLGYTVDSVYGGLSKDMASFGMLSEETGRACTSVRSLVTVQAMVTSILGKWGNEAQKSGWLPQLATGRLIGAFALTEPEHGSDAAGIRASVRIEGDTVIINGKKKWITFGQIADIFLVFGKLGDQTVAVMVESGSAGLSVRPIRDMLGARGSMLAELTFTDCRVLSGNMIGRPGMGLTPIAFSGLQVGRLSIAFGCLGMIKSCYEASVRYARTREQFGKRLEDHQLIQERMAEMLVNLRATGLLCEAAACAMGDGEPSSMKEVLIAKYYASRAASIVTRDAVQILGANGCSGEYPVERFFRDAKIMEIIEGSSQVIQTVLSKYGFQEVNNF